jgi:superfamily II DNA or RNA helicase
LRLEFDRGTLKLEASAPSALEDLPGVLWDARTASYRAPPWLYAGLVRDLRARGLELDDEVDDQLGHGGKGSVSAASWQPISLRPYQQAALSAWELAGRRGVIALPTGSGKTRVAIAAMKGAAASCLCLVPTRVLLHQWREEIARCYSGPVAVWGDGQRGRAAITVITFESAYRYMHRLGGAYSLLVVDEVHHFGQGLRDEALEMAVAPHRLGLTGTPPQGELARARLAALIGPTVFEQSVRDLAGSYLADFDLVVMRLPLDADERLAYEREMSAFRAAYRSFMRFRPDGSWEEFTRVAKSTREGRAALAGWRAGRRLLALTRGKAAALAALLDRHRHGRTLVFTADNDTAYAIARRHLVMPVTCHIQREERDQALGRFRSGELRALVSSRVLNEGIDVPDADVAVIVGGSQGEREHSQRIGRLLRPAPGKRAIVYELVADGTSETRQAERRRRGLDRA